MKVKRRNAKRIVSIICTTMLVVGYATCIPSFADTDENGTDATKATNATTLATGEKPTELAEEAPGNAQDKVLEINEKAEPQRTASGAENQVKTSGTLGTFNGSPAEVDENGNLLVNEKNFPDANFRELIVKFFEKAKATKLTNAGAFTPDEANRVDWILLDDGTKPIANMKGIEYFTSLRNITLMNQEIKEIDLSKLSILKGVLFTNCPNLVTLDVTHNPELTQIVVPTKNEIKTIDVSKCPKLKTLDLRYCPLAEVDVTNNTELITIDLFDVKLTKIDVTRNVNLEYLCCVANLQKIDVSKNVNLTDLFLDNNELTSIDLSKIQKLDYGSFANNHLSTIDLSGVNVATYMGIPVSPQTIGTLTGTTSADGTKYYVDMSQAVGKANIARINSVNDANYDPATGIATFTTKPELLNYYYKTSNPASTSQEMIVKASVKITPNGGGTTPGGGDNNNNNNNNNTRTRTTVVRTVQLAAPTPVAQLDTVEPVDDGVTSYNKPAVPDYGKEDGNWSLLSVLLTLAAIGMAVAMLIRRENNEKYRKMISIVFAIAIPIVAIVAFLMLNSITAPMVFVNPSTIALAILGVLQLVNMLIGKGKYDDYHDDENIQPAV